mgnify:CR=1
MDWYKNLWLKHQLLRSWLRSSSILKSTYYALILCTVNVLFCSKTVRTAAGQASALPRGHSRSGKQLLALKCRSFALPGEGQLAQDWRA